MYIDLHLHSNNSDGNLSVEQIEEKFNNVSREKSFFSITDHNYLSEKKFKCERDKCWIPGIEISSQFEGVSLHILGYSREPQVTKDLSKMLEKIVNGYNRRAEKQYTKLWNLGYKLPKYNSIKSSESSRPIYTYDIAQLLIPILGLSTENDVIDWCKENGNILYVEEENFMPDAGEVIKELHKSNFLVFWAHPGTRFLKDGNEEEFEKILNSLISFGLDGIECFYTSHNKNQTERFLFYTKKNKMLVSGGSDFHGIGRAEKLFMDPLSEIYIIKTLKRIGIE